MSRRSVEIITLLYIVVLTLVSTVKLSPDLPMSDVVGIDKLVHLLLYLGLTMLLLTVRCLRGFSTRLMPMVWVVLASICYGGLMEVVQHFTGRECSLLDIIANTIGALLALPLFRTTAIQRLIERVVRS